MLLFRLFVVLALGIRVEGLGSPLRQQSRFGLREPIQNPVTDLDVVSVLCRFRERYDFCEGEGYARPSDGALLTAARFYERIKDKPFQVELWPVDAATGVAAGIEGSGMSQAEIIAKLSQSPPSEEACKAVFTSFAKGASGGLAFPVQIDEEMAKFLEVVDDGAGAGRRIFNQDAFENTLKAGKLQVAVGWFLFLGLQSFAVYHLFLRPAVKWLSPELYEVLY